MAGKQLGKLRQWAGEVISVRDKTALSEEFKELEHDIELRRRGLWKLHVASESFHYRLSKKTQCDALDDDEKYLAIDALGIIMIQHGEEFGEDSAYGTSLVSLGKAHCQAATLQEAFALHFEETYLASLKRTEDEIKEYQNQRKKLDSKRLTYDAAITKVEKLRSSKKEKEKERRDAEDEYLKAKSRYAFQTSEETQEDVRARMYAIQENELEQLRELTGFLDMEMSFVQQYLDVLKDAKSNWIDEASLSQMERSRRTRVPLRPQGEESASRFNSLRSARNSARGTPDDSGSESDQGSDRASSRLSKSASVRKTKKEGNTSRPPSRSERKRADSTVSAASTATEKERTEKEKNSTKRRSVAGWVSSVTGRGKKDRIKLDTLMDDRDDVGSEDGAEDDEVEMGVQRSTSRGARTSEPSPRVSPIKARVSRGNTPNASPQLPSRILKPPSQHDKKIAVALHDFAAASSDELSFKAGDQIIVVNEVLDGWWMGEHGTTGKTGLFPTTYTEVLNASTSSLASKPPLPRRPSSNILPASISRSSASPSPSPSDASEEKRRPPPIWLNKPDVGQLAGTVSDDDHPFGDSHIAASRSPLNGGFYAESVTSSAADDDDERRLVTNDQSDDEFAYSGGPLSSSAPSSRPPPPVRRPSIPSTKRGPPPPPPPRRSTIGPGSSNSPPVNSMLNVPQPPSRPGALRSAVSSRTNSTNASYVSIPAADDDEFTSSPFDEPEDAPLSRTGCRDFKQNPFKPKGMCSNCFQMHG